jgi:hypothetical protein
MPKTPDIISIKRKAKAALGPLLSSKVGILRRRKADGNRKLVGTEDIRKGKVSRG